MESYVHKGRSTCAYLPDVANCVTQRGIDTAQGKPKDMTCCGVLCHCAPCRCAVSRLYRQRHHSCGWFAISHSGSQQHIIRVKDQCTRGGAGTWRPRYQLCPVLLGPDLFSVAISLASAVMRLSPPRGAPVKPAARAANDHPSSQNNLSPEHKRFSAAEHHPIDRNVKIPPRP